MCSNVLWAFATMCITLSVELTALLTEQLTSELRNRPQLVCIKSLTAALWGLTKLRLSLSHSVPIGGKKSDSAIKHKPVFDHVALAVPVFAAAQPYLISLLRNSSSNKGNQV